MEFLEMPWLLVLASLASPTVGMVALEFPLEMNGVERVDFEGKVRVKSVAEMEDFWIWVRNLSEHESCWCGWIPLSRKWWTLPRRSNDCPNWFVCLKAGNALYGISSGNMWRRSEQFYLSLSMTINHYQLLSITINHYQSLLITTI